MEFVQEGESRSVGNERSLGLSRSGSCRTDVHVVFDAVLVADAEYLLPCAEEAPCCVVWWALFRDALSDDRHGWDPRLRATAMRTC
jgi:hypothetical protein